MRQNNSFCDSGDFFDDSSKDKEEPTSSLDSQLRNKPRSVFTLPTDKSSLGKNGFVQCCVERDTYSPNSKLKPRYKLTFQSNGYQSYYDHVALIAEKKSGYGSSTFHIFDFSRIDGVFASSAGFKLNKKAGNYIGKLRRERNDRSSYSLFDAKKDREQHAVFVYYFPGMVKQWKEGQPPRKLKIALPSMGNDGTIEPRPHWLKNKLLESLKDKNGYSTHGLQVLETKDPAYEAGQYRLNFSGRVTVPSVKNMQIVNNNCEVVAQFGRVGENKFHLDYKSPFNAFQAFAMALTQFDV